MFIPLPLDPVGLGLSPILYQLLGVVDLRCSVQYLLTSVSCSAEARRKIDLAGGEAGAEATPEQQNPPMGCQGANIQNQGLHILASKSFQDLVKKNLTELYQIAIFRNLLYS